MKVWEILSLIFVWLYVLLKAIFLAMTGAGFAIGGFLALPKVCDVLEESRSFWQPATNWPDCWFNWLAPILYDWTPFIFLMFCLTWCAVFVIKGIKSV